LKAQLKDVLEKQELAKKNLGSSLANTQRGRLEKEVKRE